MPHRTSRKMACREFKRFVQGCTADWQDHWDLSMEYLPLPVRSHSLSHSACGIKSGSLTCLWSLSSLRSFLLQIPNTSPLFQVNCLTTGSWNTFPLSVPVAFLMSLLSSCPFFPGKMAPHFIHHFQSYVADHRWSSLGQLPLTLPRSQCSQCFLPQHCICTTHKTAC